MEHAASVSAHQLKLLLEEAEGSGVDIDDVLRSLGHENWDAPKVASGDTQISLVEFFRIEGEVARRLDDLTAHLSERKLTYETGAFVTSQINQSTTLSEALQNLAQYFNMMHGEHYNTIRTTDRTITLIINDANFPYTMKDEPSMVHFVGESVLIKVQCLLDSLSGGLAVAALRRVSVKRGLTDEIPSHLGFWTAPVSFGHDAYELCFDRTLALEPMPTLQALDMSSEGVFSRVISYLEQYEPTSEKQSYRTRTFDFIRNGVTQQEVVAHRMSISVATLRRRLEEEGTSFRALMSAHFLEEATALLRKGYSVAHVSEALDYSDIRAFNRAFKRWQGETPAKYAQRFAAVTETA
ncbi:MAG: helix-turn-helix domain-containing protein [Pseudomonadota bacterium]